MKFLIFLSLAYLYQSLPLDLWKRADRQITFLGVTLTDNLNAIDRNSIKFTAIYNAANQASPLSIHATSNPDASLTRDHVLGYDTVGVQFINWMTSKLADIKSCDTAITDDVLKAWFKDFNDKVLNAATNLILADGVFNNQVKNSFEDLKQFNSFLKNEQKSIEGGSKDALNKDIPQPIAVRTYLESAQYKEMEQATYAEFTKVMNDHKFSPPVQSELSAKLKELQDAQNQVILSRVSQFQTMLGPFTAQGMMADLEKRADDVSGTSDAKTKLNKMSSFGSYVALKAEKLQPDVVKSFMKSPKGEAFLKSIEDYLAKNPNEKRFDKMLPTLKQLAA